MKFKIGDKIKFRSDLPSISQEELLGSPSLKVRNIFKNKTHGQLITYCSSGRFQAKFPDGSTFSVYEDEIELANSNTKPKYKGHPLTNIFSNQWKPGDSIKKAKKVCPDEKELKKNPPQFQKISTYYFDEPIDLPISKNSQEFLEFQEQVKVLDYIKSLQKSYNQKQKSEEIDSYLNDVGRVLNSPADNSLKT